MNCDMRECDDTLKEDIDVRKYSDQLCDMLEDGEVDPTEIAHDLIYWCSEDDIKRFMEVNDLIDDDDEEDEGPDLSDEEAEYWYNLLKQN